MIVTIVKRLRPAWVLPVATLAIVATVIWSRLQPLGSGWAGCAVLHADGVCEVVDDPLFESGIGPLRLWADLPEGAAVRVFDGVVPLPHREVATTGGLFVEVVAPPAPRAIRVVALHGTHLYLARLTTRPRREPEWLASARKEFLDDRDDRAWSLLEPHAGDPVWGAFVVSLQGQIAREQGDTARARALFQRAIDEDRRSGLVSEEVRDRIRLAWLLADKLRSYQEAEAILGDPIFARMPDQRVWHELQRSWVRFFRGDVRSSLALLDEATTWGRRFGNPFAGMELRLARSAIHRTLGRLKEASADLDGIDESPLHPCRRANLRSQRAAVLLEQLETLSAPYTAALDPAPLLQEALAIRRSKCFQIAEVERDLLALARAALAAAQPSEAAARVTEAASLREKPDRDSAAEMMDIQGEILLAGSRWTEAEALYRRLLVTESNDSTDALERAWRARTGIARALAGMGEADQALAEFRAAEKVLDESAVWIPINAGLSGFFGRHERGTVRFLSLLEEQGKSREAMEVIRHARVRSLIAYSAKVREADARSAQEEYLRRRERLQALLVSDGGAAPERERRLSDEEVKLRRELNELLDAIYGQSPGKSSQRPAAPGEVLLACYPLVSHWLCIAAASDSAPVPLPLSRLDGGVPLLQLEEQLGKVAPLLEGARRLTIIPYGAMRQVSFESLRLGGERRLDERLEVTFSLDLPGAPAAPPSPAARPSALLLFDPGGAFAESEALAGEVHGRLREKKWEVTTYVGLATRGTWPGQSRSPFPPVPDGLTLSSRVGSTDLLVYFGHESFRSGDLGQVYLGAVSSLAAADVLVQPRVPASVVLTGCETWLAGSEVGGLEGMGIAQAFLLRGSRWVIASTIKIDPRVGAALTAALFARGLSDPNAEPVPALRSARAAAPSDPRLAKAAPDLVQRDLDAFHVFVN